MRFLSLSVLLFAGCTRQIYDPLETGDTAETGDADTDTDSDSDTDSDTDSDSDADGDPNCHPYEPISYSGWQKHFNVSYKGSTGTEDQQGYGQFGQDFAVSTALTAGANGWSGYQYFDCDNDGAYNLRFEGAYNTDTAHNITATDNPKRKFLPAPSAVSNANATWTYNYDLEISSADSGAPTGMSVATSGEYRNEGFTDGVDIAMACPSSSTCGSGGKWDNVLWIHNEYTQTPSPDVEQYMPAVTAQQDAYYAEGIGLIKEVTVDDGGNLIISKELASASGF